MGQGRNHRATLIESDHRHPARPVLRTRGVAAPAGATVEHALQRFMQLGSVSVDEREPDTGLLRVGRS